jgi:hypothetical protein
MALHNIQLQLLAKLKALREQTQQQLVAAVESKKIMGVSANIRAPTLILPANCQEENTEMLIVDLGQIALSSFNQDRKDEELDPYDDFILKLGEFKAFLTDNKPGWRSAEETKLNLIEGFDLVINLHQAKIEAANITKIKYSR